LLGVSHGRLFRSSDHSKIIYLVILEQAFECRWPPTLKYCLVKYTMRILWVKAGKLLPVETGGRIRSYHILRHLARCHELTLLSYYSGLPDPAYERALVEQFPGAITMCSGVPDGSLLARSLDYLMRWPTRMPYAVSKFTTAKVRDRVEACLAQGLFDVAVCDFLSASLNFPRFSGTPMVLFQHNIESELWKRIAQTEGNMVNRVVYKLEAARMLRYEREAIGRFQHVIAVSERDREQMKQMSGSTPISIVPTGVDLQQYQAAKGSSAQGTLVVFPGTMDFEPNIDAVTYFCQEIWPSIKVRVPSARLRIVGRSPHIRVRRLASDSVEVTGRVPSIIDHLREAAVIVVPLRIGAGTRLKIYEAMAMGKAVVSTRIGAEGLEVQDGCDLLLADDPATFSERVVQLLTDLEFRLRLETAAAQRVAPYDWSVIAMRFADVLEQVTQSLGARNAPSLAMR
jgi:polysaccharide biosynthesis protein PslH